MVNFEISTDNKGPNLILSCEEPNWFMAKWTKIGQRYDEEDEKTYLSAKHLPEDGQDILVSDGERVWSDTWIAFGDDENSEGLDSNEDPVGLWWMPMPEPPSERKPVRIGMEQ